VGEGTEDEFVGIVNYCAMALIQLELKDTDPLELPVTQSIKLYTKHINESKH